MNLKFLEIKNQSHDSADIYFYGDIMPSEWGAWEDGDTYPGMVRDWLKDVEDVGNLNIYINSGGGSVFAGIAIYNMLKRHKGHKTVYVDGLAASIASVIALAGDRVVVPSNSFFMIHKPWTIAIGDSNDFLKMAEDLEQFEKGILNVYEENLVEGASMDEVKAMVNAETWLTGEEAAQYFNIEVGEENTIAASASDFFEKYKKVPDAVVEDKQPPDDEPADDDDWKFDMQLKLDLLKS